MNTNTLFNAFSQIRGISSQLVATAMPQTVRMAGRDPLNLGTQSVVIVVKTGVAWITANGIDHVLAAGQTLSLPALAHPAIVSAAGRDGVSFDIRR